MILQPKYDLRQCKRADVLHLFERYHGYKSIGRALTYVFGVWEDGVPIAAYAWNPPPPGAAKSVCPEEPQAVLALVRMVAVPKAERQLNHVSKPLRRQMRVLLDRTRYPCLVTYSDESLGHTGHVYKCSGWAPTTRSKAPYYEDDSGRRRSRYTNGRTTTKGLTLIGHTTLQRWEHRMCSDAKQHMETHGWRKLPVPGKVWRSGNPVFKYVKDQGLK